LMNDLLQPLGGAAGPGTQHRNELAHRLERVEVAMALVGRRGILIVDRGGLRGCRAMHFWLPSSDHQCSGRP
jgi:hypothetical protein